MSTQSIYDGVNGTLEISLQVTTDPGVGGCQVTIQIPVDEEPDDIEDIAYVIQHDLTRNVVALFNKACEIANPAVGVTQKNYSVSVHNDTLLCQCMACSILTPKGG